VLSQKRGDVALDVLVDSAGMARVVVQGALDLRQRDRRPHLGQFLEGAPRAAELHDDPDRDPGLADDRIATADAGVLGDVRIVGPLPFVAISLRVSSWRFMSSLVVSS
jgi:hypothetical protein